MDPPHRRWGGVARGDGGAARERGRLPHTAETSGYAGRPLPAFGGTPPFYRMGEIKRLAMPALQS